MKIRKTSVKSFCCALVLIAILASYCMADWKSDANARIEQIRKRTAQITVVDSNSNPVPGLTVNIEQFRHRFAFGTCIAYSPLVNYANYRNFILDHYEWAVCENEMKWINNEGTRDVETYSQADYIANWCAANGLTLRGHTVVWETGNQTPSWVPGLQCATYPTNSEMLQEVDERINSIVGRYAGQIVQWDINNEMLSGNKFDCLGEAGRAHMFALANSIDPDCVMMMNEYSGNSFGGYDGDAYVSRAQSLISRGAPVEALGIQGHVNSPFNPEQYYTYVLQELAVLGLPIMATEFDVSTADVNQRATDLENFYRICFSHPSVIGIIMWGFWDGSQWRDNAQLVEQDWTINAAGQRYISLLDEWTTEDSNYTDSNGKVGFRGFHGSYEITLSAAGQGSQTYTIELEPGDGTQQFTLVTNLSTPQPDNAPPQPNPMTWATVPTATGPSTITMTATTASDDSTPVQYYFECTNDSSKNSGWQTNTTYIATGLMPNTQYSFRVKARDSSINLNETNWSSTQSATTLPPAAEINIIGSWATGTSHTKETGYDRLLIFIAHEESVSGSPSLTSVTYGGQPMTKIIDACAVSGYGNYVAAFMLKEPNIAAASSSTFVPTWSGSTNTVSYASVFLENVDQNNPIGQKASASTTSGTDPISTGALGTSDGDMVILGATCGNNGSYTLGGGFIEGTDQSVGSNGHTGVTGYKPATGAAETPTADFIGIVNRQVIIGFVVNAHQIPQEPTNCAQVQLQGYRLASDLNGDCYVDFLDLDVISDWWLGDNCGVQNNCDGADFEPTDGTVDFHDFSDFAEQWMQCNDPENENCTPNWP